MERKEHAMATQEDRKDVTPSEDSKAYEGDGPGKVGLLSDRHPEGKGGTWEARGGDSGKLGRPAEILSDHNGPSDPASRK
jgi:hypothetical protein